MFPRSRKAVLVAVTGLLAITAPNIASASAATASAQPSIAATSVIQAENYSMQSGTGTRTVRNDLGSITYVGYISNNDWTAYNNVDFGTGLQTWTATWSSYEGDLNPGKIELHVDGIDLPAVATMTVNYTDNWSSFVTRSLTLPYAISGVHQVELRYVTSTGKDFMNIDKFQFS